MASSEITPFSSIPVHPWPEDSAKINVSLPERFISAGVGGLLAVVGIARGSLGGAALAATGGFLLYRGLSGHCPGFEALGIDTAEHDANAWAVEVHTSVTVNRPRSEVYGMWQDLENLPRFMHHIESVTDLGDGRSRWKARIPTGIGTVEWEARTIEDRDSETIAWRSLPDADVDNAGVVRFQDAPGDNGTEVRAEIAYRPPAGKIGGVLASWLSPALDQMVKEDVRRFKQIVEAGEVPTTEGQTSGRA